MKVQLGHSRNGNFKKDLYELIEKSDLYKNHNFIFPHTNNKAINSKKSLKDVDVFLCEVSDPSIGLGIEIGFASLYNKRIICFYKKGVKISGSLNYVTSEFIEYSGKMDMINKLKAIL